VACSAASLSRLTLVIHLDLPLGFALELDLDPDRGRIDSARWSCKGLTFAEARIGSRERGSC